MFYKLVGLRYALLYLGMLSGKNCDSSAFSGVSTLRKNGVFRE